MRRFRWLTISFLLSGSVLVAQISQQNPGQAQDAAWNRVLALAEGDEITVKTARAGNVRCNFTGATDSELFCELRVPAASPFNGDRQYAFARAEIMKVRRRHFNRDFKATLAASAAIGCALGWSTGGPAGCLAGGFAGTMIGGVFSFLAWYFLPGNVIYENRDVPARAASSRRYSVP